MAEQLVCNVQAWGSSPTYRQGDLIPEDCPYDVEAAERQGKLVSTEQYQEEHPGWDPEARARAEAEAKALEKVYPGYDPPTAAAMPDPVATKQMYDDAAAAEEGAAPKPVQVQQSEGAPRPTTASGTSTPPATTPKPTTTAPTSGS